MIFSFVNSEIFKITVKVFLHPFAWDSLVLVTKVSAWQGGELRLSLETGPKDCAQFKQGIIPDCPFSILIEHARW